MAAPVFNKVPGQPTPPGVSASPGNLANPLSVAGSAFNTSNQLTGNTAQGLAGLSGNFGRGASNVVGGYGALGSNANQQYHQLYGQEAGMLGLNHPGSWGILAPAAQQIQRNLTAQQGGAIQQAINNGLGNSTVAASMQRGPAYDAQLALQGLNSQRLQMGANLMQNTLGQGINMQYGAGMQGLGFAGQALNNQYGYGMQGLGMLNQQAMMPYGMYGQFMSPYLQQQQMNQQMQQSNMRNGPQGQQPAMAPGGMGAGAGAGGGGLGFYHPQGFSSNFGQGVDPKGGSGSGFSSNFGSPSLTPSYAGSYSMGQQSPSVVNPQADNQRYYTPASQEEADMITASLNQGASA